MGDGTGIEWTDATWNPVRGCSRVSEGCRNCYAERVATRFSGPGAPYEGLVTDKGRWNGQVRLVPEHLGDPLRWRRPRRIFVNSMSDLFHENLSDETIAAVFGVMAACPQHTFQVLTKRPARAVRWFEWLRAEDSRRLAGAPPRESGWELTARDHCVQMARRADALAASDLARAYAGPWPLPNVWLGVSVENQAAADERIPLLLRCPAAVRWISAEPLLGPVDLGLDLDERHEGEDVATYGEGGYLHRHDCPNYCDYACGGEWYTGERPIGWVVCGGESGPGARPMHMDWARSLRDQCAAAGVPYLFKQWGAWAPLAAADKLTADPELTGFWDYPELFSVGLSTAPFPHAIRVGKHAAGRLLDGVLHDGYPEVHA